MRGFLAHLDDEDAVAAQVYELPERQGVGRALPASVQVHVHLGDGVITMSREQAEQLRDALAAALGGEA